VSGFQQARIELGARLRQLREGSRLSGKELAERLKWQPSKVSRIENARQTASPDDVAAWARAVRAAPETVDELVAVVAAMTEQQESWRQRYRTGLAALQEDVRDLEARTTAFRVFEPGIIVGLLQTAEYARAVFRTVRHLYSSAEEIDAAVQVRMQRQEILYDQSRRFRFLLPEAALRYRMATLEVMAGQLDRLLAVTGLPNVEFGIIPFEAFYPSAPLNGFWIYDDTLVGVPTRTKWLLLNEPDEIDFYAATFEDLYEVAVFREQARSILIRAIEEITTQSSF
jgi:transcriptional regulator with XRE-family HTH domain